MTTPFDNHPYETQKGEVSRGGGGGGNGTTGSIRIVTGMKGINADTLTTVHANANANADTTNCDNKNKKDTKEYITDLYLTDVLFGRGSGPNDHEGNIRFRTYVAERKVEYMATNNRLAKTKIAREIVNLVLNDNGRFLKKLERQESIELGLIVPDSDSNNQDNNHNNDDDDDKDEICFYEVQDDDTIMEKAKQALRQNATKFREEILSTSKVVVANSSSSSVSVDQSSSSLTRKNNKSSNTRSNNINNNNNNMRSNQGPIRRATCPADMANNIALLSADLSFFPDDSTLMLGGVDDDLDPFDMESPIPTNLLSHPSRTVVSHSTGSSSSSGGGALLGRKSLAQDMVQFGGTVLSPMSSLPQQINDNNNNNNSYWINTEFPPNRTSLTVSDLIAENEKQRREYLQSSEAINWNSVNNTNLFLSSHGVCDLNDDNIRNNNNTNVTIISGDGRRNSNNNNNNNNFQIYDNSTTNFGPSNTRNQSNRSSLRSSRQQQQTQQQLPQLDETDAISPDDMLMYVRNSNSMRFPNQVLTSTLDQSFEQQGIKGVGGTIGPRQIPPSFSNSNSMLDYLPQQQTAAGTTHHEPGGIRASLTMNDLIAARANMRRESSSAANHDDDEHPDVIELMDSLNAMSTSTGADEGMSSKVHNKLMSSTETMGTIDQLGSVADMSIGTMESAMGSSIFSALGGSTFLMDSGFMNPSPGHNDNQRSNGTSNDSSRKNNLGASTLTNFSIQETNEDSCASIVDQHEHDDEFFLQIRREVENDMRFEQLQRAQQNQLPVGQQQQQQQNHVPLDDTDEVSDLDACANSIDGSYY
jgi:hypothetical protein